MNYDSIIRYCVVNNKEERFGFTAAGKSQNAALLIMRHFDFEDRQEKSATNEKPFGVLFRALEVLFKHY